MTLRPDSFRVSAFLCRPGGDCPLELRGAFAADPEQAVVVLEWTELDRVRLRLESEDELALLSLEGCEIQVPAGVQRTVPGPEELRDDTYPWYPGDYQIQVQAEGTVWYGLFRVKPRHLAADQLARLRQDLEQVVAGLTLDVLAHRGYQGPQDAAAAPGGIRLRQLSLLRRALQEVAPIVGQIEREPQRQLGRRYGLVPWHQAQRLDGKSFRWLARGEWMHSGKAAPAGWNQPPRAVLAPAASQSYDTYENRVVRFILERFAARARLLESALETDLASAEREVSEAQQRGWATGELEQRLESYRRLQPRAAEVARGFEHLVHRPFLSAVAPLQGLPVPTTTLLKDARYRVLYRWHRQVEEALVTVDTGELFQMRTKRTSKLYEYWCLLKVVEIFGQLGFRLADGDFGMRLREANRDRLIPIIQPGSVFLLEDGWGRRLRIVYDQELPVTQEQAREVGSDLYIANPRNRPDIRVDLLDGERPLRCLVLDAKYRRLASIWHRAQQGVVYQLLSYSTNLYHVSQPRIPLTQVAVALYPGADGDPDWQTREAGSIALGRMAPGHEAAELRACFRRFVGDVDAS